MTAENSKKQKPRGKSFEKGRTGNAGGRPKRTPEELDLVAACKAKAPEALAVLIEIMQNGEQEKNRMSAAQVIIERGYGKPTQAIDATVDAKLMVEIVRFGLKD